jgi:DNA-binding MurR/RpiR family transcriptional regulator
VVDPIGAEAVTPRPSGEQAVAEIAARVGTLVPSERRVAEVVLADPHGLLRRTAGQVAVEAATSATTVVRFARSVGYSGFQDLALALARTAGPPPQVQAPITAGDSAAEIAGKVAASAASALAGATDTLDADDLQRCAEVLARARHVLVLGAGMTAPVAMDAAYRFIHLRLSAEFVQDEQIQRVRVRGLGAEDVCLVIAHGGTYRPLVTLAREAGARGATVVAITSYRGTPLTDAASISLVAGGQAVTRGLEAWSSRLVHLAVVDMLFETLRHRVSPLAGALIDGTADMIEVSE